MPFISLTKGLKTLVDECDYGQLSKFRWCIFAGYAGRNMHMGKVNGKFKLKSILMHRLILSAPQDMQVDHINGDKLDNRRSNLRLCTKSQNAMNLGEKTADEMRNIDRIDPLLLLEALKDAYPHISNDRVRARIGRIIVEAGI